MTTKHLNKPINYATNADQAKTTHKSVSTPTRGSAHNLASTHANPLAHRSASKSASAPTNKMRAQLTKNRPNHQNTHKSFRKSERAIHRALHREMSTRHSQISVTEFCQIAKISNFTFYAHYKSISDAFISYELEIQTHLQQMLIQLGVLDSSATSSHASRTSRTSHPLSSSTSSMSITPNISSISSTSGMSITPNISSTSSTPTHSYTTSSPTKASHRELLFTCVLSTISKYRTYFKLSFRNHDFFLLHKLIQIIAPYLTNTNQRFSPTTLTLYYGQLAAVITCWAMHDNFSAHKTTLYTHRLTRVRLIVL